MDFQHRSWFQACTRLYFQHRSWFQACTRLSAFEKIFRPFDCMPAQRPTYRIILSAIVEFGRLRIRSLHLHTKCCYVNSWHCRRVIDILSHKHKDIDRKTRSNWKRKAGTKHEDMDANKTGETDRRTDGQTQTQSLTQRAQKQTQKMPLSFVPRYPRTISLFFLSPPLRTALRTPPPDRALLNLYQL